MARTRSRAARRGFREVLARYPIGYGFTLRADGAITPKSSLISGRNPLPRRREGGVARLSVGRDPRESWSAAPKWFGSRAFRHGVVRSGFLRRHAACRAEKEIAIADGTGSALATITTALNAGPASRPSGVAGPGVLHSIMEEGVPDGSTVCYLPATS